MVCRGGFRDFGIAIDDNVGSKPALTQFLGLSL